MEHIINKTVVFDYFSGDVTPLQEKSVERRLAEANNRAYYYQWLHEWELAHPQISTDWQQALERTAGRLSEPFLNVQNLTNRQTEGSSCKSITSATTTVSRLPTNSVAFN